MVETKNGEMTSRKYHQHILGPNFMSHSNLPEFHRDPMLVSIFIYIYGLNTYICVRLFVNSCKYIALYTYLCTFSFYNILHRRH